MSWLAELVTRNSPDPRVRLELGAEIVNIVSETRLPNDSKILNDFCDLIVQWMSASNFKVSLLATQIASRSIDVSGDLISPYIVDRLRHFVERLGASKANVRDATVDLLNDLSQTNNASPQVVLEKLIGELGHRQYMVKIGAMQVIKDIIDENRQLVEAQTKKLIPSLCKLMADANSDVREMAASTLVTCCVNYGGDNVCHQIAANQRLPSAKLQLIKDRYRRAQNSAPVTNVSNHINQIPSTSRHSLPSTTPRRPMARASYNKSLMTFRASSVPAKNAAGAVSEDQFRQAFNDVPRKAIYDGRELASAVETVRTTLENPNIDWDRRVKALKELRGVINGGALDFPDFEDLFRSLETGIVTSIKDLRSQVCREGCITLAFLCEKLDKCTIARLTETTMPILILLMQNSAKVMATSGILASSYVVRHSRNPKIVQLVIDGQKHKSKEIRRSCIGLINDILANWEPKVTERSIGSIVEAIRAGLCDADAEARQKARVAYGELEAKFNKQAMFLYQSLDPSKQKMLHGQVSQSSSTHSVASERDIAQKRAANYHALRSTSDINIGSARRVQQTPSRYAKPTPAAVSAVRPQRTTASSVSAARPPIGTQRKVLSAPTPQPTSKSVSQPGSRSTSPKRTTTSKPRLVTGATNGSPNRMYAPLKHNGRSLSGTNRAEMERALQAAFRNHSTESDGSFEGAALSEAVRNCVAPSAPQKKEGLKALQICLSQQTPLNHRDAKRVYDALAHMFHERNTNMLGQYAQVFAEFLANYSDQVVEFLPQILSRLLPRIATEPLPSSKKYLREVMGNIVSYLPAQNQFLALCKHITDPTHTHSLPVKQLVLAQMRDVVKGVDASSVLLNTSECRLAFTKIFQWMEDLKSGDQVRSYADQLFLSMFALNPSDLASLLSTVSTHHKDYVYDLLQDSKSAATSEDSSNFNDDIRATTALINDFVVSSNHRMHESSNSPPSMLSRHRNSGPLSPRHNDSVDGPSTSMFNIRDHQTREKKSVSQPGSRSTSPKRTTTSKPRVVTGATNGSPNRMYAPLKHNGRSLSGTNHAEMERALQAAFRNHSTESDGSFEGAALSEAVRNCVAPSAPQKKEGLKALQICLSQQTPLNHRDAKRVYDALAHMFHERNTNMLGQYAQVFAEFLANYSDQVVEFLPQILSRLLPRIATEPLPSSKKYLREVMGNIVSYLPAQNQFLALCKHITDPTHTHSLPVKQLVLAQMRDVVKGVDASSVLLNTSECRLAFTKIFQWMEDLKSGDQVRSYADQLFLLMFALNPSDLASLLSTVSTHHKDYVYDLLQDSKSAATSEDSSNFNDDIRATTALINDFVVSSNHRMHESSNSPSSMLSRHCNGGPLSPRHNDSVDGPSTSMFNIRDHQTKLITDICSILHSRDESPDDKLQALGMLSQMTRDGSFTLWEDHFGQIIVVIMQVLKNSSGELKKAALRAVKDICSSQASRFNSVAEMTISGVLKAFNDPEAAVTRMAEDCGSTLATHLNVQVCLRVLLPVVNSGSADPSAVSGAIKMIGKLLESVTPEQVMSMLPTVAPGIVEAYNSDNSSIRRASVLVLVGIYNIVGDKIMPYMQELNKTKLTLFEVYIKKVQNGTANIH
ncbi:hypothetical protein QR680_003482 [Steinernema hermaphroditum]|uniref:TOG domain-containing protein n=1 Tax=Steinernema hermaphroditum TaxID=289476 RepID=A0AA39HKI5_9BILA|nr:hypothetical protein QR680_003482 [Steinernema hermaphroditum]